MSDQEGVRERKRRETLARITEAGVRLFIERRYEATTLDDIAAAAGISRRTFFSYFKSKDEILLSMQSGMGDMLAAALREQSLDKPPFQAVRDAVLHAAEPYAADELIVLDRLMRSSEAVQARKQASYVQHERTLFEAMRERWPDPARETALRLLAMMAIGVVRISTDAISRENGTRSITAVLAETFAALEKELAAAASA